MNDVTNQAGSTTDPINGMSVSPQFSAARLMAGGLSLLLVLAFALAAGVPAGQLLATVGGHGSVHGEADRAVAPQVVERQARRLAQERPVPVGAHRFAARVDAGRCDKLCRAGQRGVVTLLVREALLALPPPACV